MLHQLFVQGLQTSQRYLPWTQKVFLQRALKRTMDKFFVWLDTRSRNDNTLHGSGTAVEESEILLQMGKAAEICHSDIHIMCLILKMQ